MAFFSAPFTLTANVDRNESTLSVPAFNPLNFLNIPSGATHFRIINALSVISDFVLKSCKLELMSQQNQC